MEGNNVNVKGLIAVGFIFFTIVIAGYWYFVDYAEFKQKKEELLQETNRLSSKIKELKSKESIDENIVQMLKKIEKELAAMKKAIPQNNKVPDILNTIEEVVSELNEDANPPIKFKEIRISPIQPQDTYSIQPLELIIVGKFHDIGRFLSKLENLKRFNVNAGTVSLNPTRDVKKNTMLVTMTLRLNAFMLNSGGGMAE